jgi:hypothetical protein
MVTYQMNTLSIRPNRRSRRTIERAVAERARARRRLSWSPGPRDENCVAFVCDEAPSPQARAIRRETVHSAFSWRSLVSYRALERG